MATTHKKVKVIGTKKFIDPTTGEIESMQVTSIEERDANFHKVWMHHFISTLDIIGNKKIKLCGWIIDHLNKENQLTYTYRQIAKEGGFSLDTVRITMSRLLEADFMRKVNQGCYMVNPNIVFKGARGGRLNVLNQYHEAEKQELSTSEKIQNLKNSIDTLTVQLKKLQMLEEANAGQDETDSDMSRA